MKDRIDYIDTAKGIGIILVVWLHMGSIGKLPYFIDWGGYITTFYMILFFVMSGMFFRPIHMKKKVYRLMVPYFSFYVLAFGIYVVKGLLKGEMIDWMNFFVPLCGGTSGYENTPIWFLLSLTQIMLLAALLLRLWYSRWMIAFVFVLAVAFHYYRRCVGEVPYYIDVSFVCLPFFLCGHFFKSFFVQKLKGIMAVVAFALSIILYSLMPGFVNVSQDSMPQGFLMFAVVAMLASMGVIGISRHIQGRAAWLLQLLGKNSLGLMCIHMMLMTVDSALCRMIPNVVAANWVGLIIITAIALVFSLLISKYCPKLVGR